MTAYRKNTGTNHIQPRTLRSVFATSLTLNATVNAEATKGAQVECLIIVEICLAT
jgi:hypothetical protein